jgi:putative acetyltransferase
MLEILKVETSENLEQVCILWNEYGECMETNLADISDLPELVKYFREYYEEINNNLPGEYTPPEGCLLLAKYNSQTAGCIGLRKYKNDICEARRLFVRKKYRRMGIAKTLVEALANQARNIGYKRIWLHTNRRMTGAEDFYRAIGLKDIEPYEHFSLDNMVYLELKLT